MRALSRYIVRFAAIAAIVTASVACTLSEGYRHSPVNLCRRIWNDVNYDLSYINIILKKVILFDHMFDIEDEAEREAYIDTMLHAASIEQSGNTYTIRYINEYNTYHTQVVKTSGGRFSQGDKWEVSYDGGLGYLATITASGSGYKVTFSRLYDDKSNTTAELEMSYELTTYSENSDTLVDIEYSGRLAMTDYTESISRPLTIATTITQPVQYNGNFGMTGGAFDILCRDALYNSTDHIKADIDSSTGLVTIEYYGSRWTEDVKNRVNL